MEKTEGRLEILLSCMFQKDDIVKKSNITCNAVVINQCDEDGTHTEPLPGSARVKWIDSTQRGLSRSRNLAIRAAECDYCLIADDDEVFADGVEDIIAGAFRDNEDSDVLIFKLHNWNAKYPAAKSEVGYIQAMRTASYQIAFRRKKVIERGIMFDEEMGSGTGHGAGEECKFLFECLHSGLHITFIPETIATLQKDSASQWFFGYDSNYFFWHGWARKRFLGIPGAILYACYTAVAKHNEYKKDMTFWSALYNMFRGIASTKK